MKTGKIEIVALLDRSGSMSALRESTISAFGEFIAEQAKLPGECDVTLVQFDSDAVDTVYEARAAKDVPVLVLEPRGCTPLLDAMGATIESVGKRLAALPEEARPEHVLFLVMTDGYENASRVYKKDQIKAMVEEQTNKWKWTFTFLGAGIDAFVGAGSVGIPLANSMGVQANAAGVHHAYGTASSSVRNLRSGQGYNAAGMGTQPPQNTGGNP